MRAGGDLLHHGGLEAPNTGLPPLPLQGLRVSAWLTTRLAQEADHSAMKKERLGVENVR